MIYTRIRARGPSSIRAVSAALVAAMTASLAFASVAGASTFGPAQVLTRAPSNVPMVVSDIATQGRNIAVTWTHTISPGTLDQYSFMRVSTDGGQTFGPELSLNGGNGAVSAKAAICGGYAWAITSIQTGPDRFGIGLDGWQLGGSAHSSGEFDRNVHVSTAESLDSDFTCVGDQRLAAIWSDPTTNPARAMLAIRPLWPCAQNPGPSCDPGPSYTFDLGLKRHGETPYIAATDTTIYAAWTKDNGALNFKRFNLAPDGTIAALPTTILMHGSQLSNPNLAADGSRVVLAYDRRGTVRVRVSNDGGANFGPSRTLGPRYGHARATIESVSASGDAILVEIGEGNCPTCYGIAASRGVLSTDGGLTWSATSAHAHSRQIANFYVRAGTLRIAETWDQSQTNNVREKLYLHTGSI